MKPLTLAALGLIAVGVFLSLGGRVPEPKTPTMEYVAPTGELLNLVAPLKAYRGKPASAAAGKFYADFAEVLSRDSTVLKTTGQFRDGHQRAQALFAQKTDMVGSMPGASAQIDSVLVRWLGTEDGPLDRAKAIEACRAIAWALGGAN